MISTTSWAAAVEAAGFEAINANLRRTFGGDEARPIFAALRTAARPARGFVYVRAARRRERISLEFLRWHHPNRVALRRGLADALELDHRQARALARRLGRLRARLATELA